MTFPRRARLGVDVGKARIGVAASDPDGLLAMPVVTVKRSSGNDVLEIANICQERDIVVVYMGLPRHLNGQEGEAATDARRFAAELRKQIPDLDVRFIDERLTTVTATANLQAAGRKANRQRSVIDQQAAVIILQMALDVERESGKRAGIADNPA
jgi:putative Holliday junction resolvase